VTDPDWYKKLAEAKTLRDILLLSPITECLPYEERVWLVDWYLENHDTIYPQLLKNIEKIHG